MSRPDSRALTVTTTKDRQNITWAITIVTKPRMLSTPAATNIASSDDPMTTSGVAMGRKITRLETDLPWKECLTSANAINVPRMVARTVAVALTARLRRRDSHSPSGSQMLDQFAQVNASKWADADLPDGSLNESATM